jgi:hypothetical protein
MPGDKEYFLQEPEKEKSVLEFQVSGSCGKGTEYLIHNNSNKIFWS